jgi:DNA-binding phage protein
MDFKQLQQELGELLEDVKKTLQLPVDEKGNLLPGASLSMQDLEKLVERAQEMADRLNGRASELAKNAGMTREEMEERLKDPKNFSPEEWKIIQGMKQQMDQFQTILKRTVAMQGDQQQIQRSREALRGNPAILSQKRWMKL